MDISQMYQLLGMYSGSGSGYGLYKNYGNYNNYGLLGAGNLYGSQNIYGTNAGTFGQVLKNTASVQNSGGISTPMDEIFEEASRETGVDVRLLKAVGKAESNFRASATSRCGAMGIMQLMPGTAKSLGVTDAYDAKQNIMAGSRYLAKLLDKYDGDTKLALAAYNAGSGNVAKYGGIPPFKETQNYVKRVLEYAGEDFRTGQTVKTDVSDENSWQQAGSDTPVMDFEYGDIYKMAVQMIQLQMQQKLQGLLDFNREDSGSGSVFL